MSNTPVTAEDLYLYAMQLLEPDEHARLENFLLQSPEARAELANVRGDLALLAMTAEQQAPPASSRQRFLKEVARERKNVPAAPQQASVIAMPEPAQGNLRPMPDVQEPEPMQGDTYTPSHEAPLPFRSFVTEEETPSRGFLSAVLPWAGWAVAAGLAVSTWDFYHKAENMQDQVAFANATAARASANSAKAEAVMDTLRSGAAQRFTLVKQSTQPIPSARVTYLADKGSLVFQGSNLEQLPPYKTYELWLIPVGEGRQPIPAGTFKPDARGYASVILPELPKGVVAGTFGVTMEDDGGAQTPTLPILMIGS